jgi:hypothetical protein
MTAGAAAAVWIFVLGMAFLTGVLIYGGVMNK